ncbi:hypothetical protein, partial [Lewinella sp. 4G2]|uniref:hypothetical protein n=1 Tax=Lewinella sp. 4G2 TaxID=1803372 RepID=UPI0012F9AB38
MNETDTIPVVVPPGEMVTVCADTTMLSAPYESVEFCEMPTNGTAVLDQATGCVTYTAGPDEGVMDEICLVVTDTLGFTDTTIVQVSVPMNENDTIPVVVPPGEMVTVCADTTMLSAPYESVEFCEMPANGTAVLDQATGCVTYTAGPDEGVMDEICLVVTDTLGFTDTTIVQVSVPMNETDTIPVVVPPGEMVTVCADTTMLSAPYESVEFCEMPTNGTAILDQATGCVTYTA